MISTSNARNWLTQRCLLLRGWNCTACQSTSTPTASRSPNGKPISSPPRPHCVPPRPCGTFSDPLSCRCIYGKLTDEAIAAWPRTGTGRLTTCRQQLQLNADLPAIDELLKVRALRKLIEAFGDSLIRAVNSVTGKLHTSFMIAGASTGRFSARGPNLQQMPKGKQKGFRRIFAAPAGQLVMALDYSQIELRAVAEIDQLLDRRRQHSAPVLRRRFGCPHRDCDGNDRQE